LAQKARIEINLHFTECHTTTDAADWMTTFYQAQTAGAGEPGIPYKSDSHWISCFSDAIKGSIKRMFFVVLLPDGTMCSDLFVIAVLKIR
jgi:hypothetical protein